MNLLPWCANPRGGPGQSRCQSLKPWSEGLLESLEDHPEGWPPAGTKTMRKTCTN